MLMLDACYYAGIATLHDIVSCITKFWFQRVALYRNLQPWSGLCSILAHCCTYWQIFHFLSCWFYCYVTARCYSVDVSASSYSQSESANSGYKKSQITFRLSYRSASPTFYFAAVTCFIQMHCLLATYIILYIQVTVVFFLDFFCNITNIIFLGSLILCLCQFTFFCSVSVIFVSCCLAIFKQHIQVFLLSGEVKYVLLIQFSVLPKKLRDSSLLFITRRKSSFK